MKRIKQNMERRARRRTRIRGKVYGTAQRPRISVFRSNKAFSAQLINDEAGHTLAAVSTLEQELAGQNSSDRVTNAGKIFAQRAEAAGVKEALFDRNGYAYHGNVRSFAEAVREGGLQI